MHTPYHVIFIADSISKRTHKQLTFSTAHVNEY